MELARNDRLGTERYGFPGGVREALDERRGIVERMAYVGKAGALHQHRRQRALGKPEPLHPRVQHLIEALAERDDHEATAEQASEMHRRLAVADHRDLEQRARLLDRRVL